MIRDLAYDREQRRAYLENRAKASQEELARYAGKWIAWSPDGTHIVAHSEEPEALDTLILGAGEDPERCIIEGIPEEDTVLGGGGLGQGLR